MDYAKDDKSEWTSRLQNDPLTVVLVFMGIDHIQFGGSDNWGGTQFGKLNYIQKYTVDSIQRTFLCFKLLKYL